MAEVDYFANGLWFVFHVVFVGCGETYEYQMILLIPREWEMTDKNQRKLKWV